MLFYWSLLRLKCHVALTRVITPTGSFASLSFQFPRIRICFWAVGWKHKPPAVETHTYMRLTCRNHTESQQPTQTAHILLWLPAGIDLREREQWQCRFKHSTAGCLECNMCVIFFYIFNERLSEIYLVCVVWLFFFLSCCILSYIWIRSYLFFSFAQLL